MADALRIMSCKFNSESHSGDAVAKITLDLPLARLPSTASSVASLTLQDGTHAMIELLNFISEYVIGLYKMFVIAAVILSWLLAFNVINYSNPFVKSVWQAVNAVTEPLLAPIRRVLPNMGGLDLSPIVLLLGCIFLQTVVIPNLQKLFM